MFGLPCGIVPRTAAPSFTTATLEWQGRDAAFWQARLAQIPGIVEVEVSQNEQLAYLKVSKDLLDEAALSDSLILDGAQTAQTS